MCLLCFWGLHSNFTCLSPNATLFKHHWSFSFSHNLFFSTPANWRFAAENGCSTQRFYLCFCLHLPAEGAVFALLSPIPLGNLPQSGVYHNINHGGEWRSRRRLTCESVYALHPSELFTFLSFWFELVDLHRHATSWSSESWPLITGIARHHISTIHNTFCCCHGYCIH